MTVNLDQPDFRRLCDLVTNSPEFAFAQRRHGMLVKVFNGAPRANAILNRINYDGTASTVAVDVITLLTNYGQIAPGREALGMFVDELLANTGGGEDADFLVLVSDKYKLKQHPPTQVSTPIVIPLSQTNRASEDCYIFISYAHADNVVADEVEAFLRNAKLRLFRDVRDISVGDNWDMKIETGLHETTHMVLLLSQASMPYRKEVYREWFYYDQQNKPILPLFIQDCTLHSRFASNNYTDGRQNLADALPRLLTGLN